MSHAQTPRTRKRKPVNECAPEPKRPKLPAQSAARSHQHEADFWVSLSKIWVTRHALKEFDRRSRCCSRERCRPGHVQQPPAQTRLQSQRDTQRLARVGVTVQSLVADCGPSALKKIKLSARRGGLDLSDLRGCSKPAPVLRDSMDSTRSTARSLVREDTSASAGANTPSATSVTRQSKRSGPADGNYEQKLIDGGIFPYGYEYPDGREVPLPSGWEELNQRLARRRSSLSPSRISKDRHEKFARADSKAEKEAQVKMIVLPLMLQAMHAELEDAMPEQLFTNMEPIANGIARPMPDFYHGLRCELIHSQARKDLGSHIIPGWKCPAVPNFFVEIIGPHGDVAEGLLQCCHYGAIGARAMQSLETYGQSQPIYDNQVRTISALYGSGTLRLYGHSVAQPQGPGTRPEYYMHQIDIWGMTGKLRTFVEGATAYKNAVEWMSEQRSAAVARINSLTGGLVAHDNGDSSALPSLTVDYANSSSNAAPGAGEEEDKDRDTNETDGGSQTSLEPDLCAPPAKRRSKRTGRRRHDELQQGHRTAGQGDNVDTGAMGKQRRSWFGW